MSCRAPVWRVNRLPNFENCIGADFTPFKGVDTSIPYRCNQSLIHASGIDRHAVSQCNLVARSGVVAGTFSESNNEIIAITAPHKNTAPGDTSHINPNTTGITTAAM